MQSLTNLIAAGRSMLERERKIMADPNSSPQDAHDAGLHEKQHVAEIERMEATLSNDLEIIGILRNLEIALDAPKFTSANRTLAREYLENAESRLLREIG